MAFLYDIDSSSRLGLDCIDDRGLMAQNDVQQNIKTPAGVYGLAQDLHIARLTKNPEAYEQEVQPLGESAKIIANRLGMICCTHQVCAAEQGVLSIGRTIIEKPEQTLAIAKRIHGGDITDTEYETVANAYGHILFSGLTKAFRGAEREASCMDNKGLYVAIPRKPLANSDHVSTELYVNHRKGTWFDAVQAHRAGNARYHADQWAIPDVAEQVDDILPHDNVDGFVLASSIRLAATSQNLPYGGDESRLGLDIRTIAA